MLGREDALRQFMQTATPGLLRYRGLPYVFGAPVAPASLGQLGRYIASGGPAMLPQGQTIAGLPSTFVPVSGQIPPQLYSVISRIPELRQYLPPEPPPQPAQPTPPPPPPPPVQPAPSPTQPTPQPSPAQPTPPPVTSMPSPTGPGSSGAIDITSPTTGSTQPGGTGTGRTGGTGTGTGAWGIGWAEPAPDWEGYGDWGWA